MLTPSEAELANMSASLIVWRGSNTYWMKPCHFQETVTSSDLQMLFQQRGHVILFM